MLYCINAYSFIRCYFTCLLINISRFYGGISKEEGPTARKFPTRNVINETGFRQKHGNYNLKSLSLLYVNYFHPLSTFEKFFLWGAFQWKAELTQVGHGVHAGTSAFPPQEFDGGERDQQEDGQSHREADQQGKVRLHDDLS